ncbi:atp3 gamma subunit of the F1 sector of mitochondrial F1F0 ATP synthase [Chytridiales sp. JEL 0842]|nr:atp3 gamma subunit of the F1 sector of mitochondrial F1F0 ATP synthase [Chytridiales sp. JEL 0842]
MAAASPVVMGQTRNYATLKEISLRLKAISNIGKITKSMKMIASTKVTKAQRNMEVARIYGNTANALFKHTETAEPENAQPLVIACSSDRGLCGGIHSNISKNVRRFLANSNESPIVIIGMKAKNQISRDYRDNIVMTFEQVAKNVPNWMESSLIADQIIANGSANNLTKIFYNHFKSVIAYEIRSVPVYTAEQIAASPKLSQYEVDDHILKNFQEFTFANSLHWAISEGYASEMAAKRAAMENATKNADEMIGKLTLIYNRSRQASITNDLIDIIVGASAM